jgi:hypothetical protein
MCNITHVKTTKIVTFFIKKNNNYLLESCIFNIKCTSFNINLPFFFNLESLMHFINYQKQQYMKE